jgi:hypothetical protein
MRHIPGAFPSKKSATALQAGVLSFAPFLRAGFQTGVSFTMKDLSSVPAFNAYHNGLLVVYICLG